MAMACPDCGAVFEPADPEAETHRCPGCGRESQSRRPAGDGQGDPPLGPGDAPAWESGPSPTNLLRTIRQVLLRPVRTMAAPAPPGRVSPLIYALILGLIGYMGAAFWLAVLGGAPGVPWQVLAGQVLISPLKTCLLLVVETLVHHFFLWMLGGTRTGLAGTWRAVCYSQAALVFYLVPRLGGALVGVWGAVAAAGGLAGAHGSGKTRATLAVVLPYAILLGLAFLAAALQGKTGQMVDSFMQKLWFFGG